jgi:glycosyltransferase involved in cell wall biosynthesis
MTIKATLCVNGLSANNTSSINVIVGHILNLRALSPSCQISIITYQDSALYRLIRTISGFPSLTFIFLPSFLSSFPVRVFLEQFVLPFVLSHDCILLNSAGYFIFLYRGYQISICQNPYPFYLYYQNNFSPTSLKWLLLLLMYRLSCIFNSHNKVLSFNSFHMKQYYEMISPGGSIKNSFILPNPILSLPTSNSISFSTPRFTFLVVSPFVRYKQPHLAIQAFSIFSDLCQQAIKYNLVLIGRILDSVYFDECVAYVPDHLSNHVSFYTDYVTDAFLWRAFDDSLAYISMSLCESFGLPAIEAQLHGVPSIVLKGTAAEEVCSTGCIVCDDQSPTLLASHMHRLALDTRLWRFLSEQSIENSHKYTRPHVSHPLLAHLLAL